MAFFTDQAGRSPMSLVLLTVMTLLLSACTSIGTRELPKNRVGFSDAMISSEEQQLLLNIVRIHFDDRPYFVNVDSITTSTNLSLSSNPSYNYSETPSNPAVSSNLDNVNNALVLTSKNLSNSFSKNWSLGLNPGATYSDAPTISYSPLQGDKFTSQMLAPVSIETLYTLLNGGWRAGKIMRLLVEEIRGYENGIFPYKDILPEYKQFVNLVNMLRDMQKKHMIAFDLGEISQVTVSAEMSEQSKQEVVTFPAVKTLDLLVMKKHKNAPEVTRLYRELDIKGRPGIIHFVNSLRIGMANEHDNIVTIKTRCFLSMLDFLSYSVESPPALVKKGVVQAPQYPDGRYFDLSKLTDGLFKVHMSSQRPHENVSVAVYYRNHWFYVADDDVDSKRTMALVEQLFNLQAGSLSGNASAPVLTIPLR